MYSFFGIGQKTSLDYYLPQNGSYNTKIPIILNFELGEMHTDHTQVAIYEELQKHRTGLKLKLQAIRLKIDRYNY
jgi:hypothetical protein